MDQLRQVPPPMYMIVNEAIFNMQCIIIIASYPGRPLAVYLMCLWMFKQTLLVAS